MPIRSLRELSGVSGTNWTGAELDYVIGELRSWTPVLVRWAHVGVRTVTRDEWPHFLERPNQDEELKWAEDAVLKAFTYFSVRNSKAGSRGLRAYQPGSHPLAGATTDAEIMFQTWIKATVLRASKRLTRRELRERLGN